MKTKKEKEKILKDLVEKFKKSKGYLLVSLLKLSTDSQKRVRDLLKENNSLFQVAKKTLVYKANPDFPFTDEELKIPFAFIWNFDDSLSGFQALKNLKKEGIEIEILKGVIQEKVLTKEEAIAVINLPSKEEIIIKLIGNLKSQIYRLDNSLKYQINRLILLLSQIKPADKN